MVLARGNNRARVGCIVTSDFDLQLYLFMRSALARFRSIGLSLGELIELINRLSELLANLEGASEQWQQRFRTEWWELEQAYAIALDRQHDLNSPEYADDIKIAIANLGVMVESAIAADG